MGEEEVGDGEGEEEEDEAADMLVVRRLGMKRWAMGNSLLLVVAHRVKKMLPVLLL